MVPNGVDPEEWLRIAPPPDWMRQLPGPRFLYVGTLDSRLDVEAVLAVARAWPQGSVVLAGPLADPYHLARLQRAAEHRPSPGRFRASRSPPSPTPPTPAWSPTGACR